MPCQASPASVLSAHFKNVAHTSSSSSSSSSATKHLVTKKMLKLLASPLISQMGIVSGRPVRLLDSACGTGAVTQEVQRVLDRDVLAQSSFVCADNSEGMVGLVRERVGEEGWMNVETRVADAADSGLPESSMTHVAVGLGLHLIPQADDVVRDCLRVLQNGGVFGASTFPAAKHYAFWAPDLSAAFASFPFAAPFPDELPMQTHDSGRWYDSQWIETHLRELGLRDVLVTVNPGAYEIESAQEFVDFFGMMISYVVSTWWSEDLRRAHPIDEVKGLVRAFLEEKHHGRGWPVSWQVICMTGVVEK